MNNYLQQHFGLSGKRALVTGASRGIGRAIAEALAAVGAQVCVHYHSSAAAANDVVEKITAANGQAWCIGADLTQSKSTQSLFHQIEQHWGALDILVNNAGDAVQRAPLDEIDDKMLEHIIAVNYGSTLLATRAAIPLLRQGTQPVIINLTSMAAHSGGLGGTSVYASSKGAILTLTRSLAKELAPHIRVNALAPGVILTDLQDRLTPPERLAACAAATPLGRNGTAEECAGAAVFLAGAGASFITGETIEINGGLWVA